VKLGKTEWENMAEQQTKLNANSYISLGVMLVIIGAAFQLSTKLARIETDLSTIRFEMSTKLDAFNGRMGDRWTATMQGVWAREVQALNQNFKTPVVEDIQRRFPPSGIK
jgi:hypothetical protein